MDVLSKTFQGASTLAELKAMSSVEIVQAPVREYKEKVSQASASVSISSAGKAMSTLDTRLTLQEQRVLLSKKRADFIPMSVELTELPTVARDLSPLENPTLLGELFNELNELLPSHFTRDDVWEITMMLSDMLNNPASIDSNFDQFDRAFRPPTVGMKAMHREAFRQTALDIFSNHLRDYAIWDPVTGSKVEGVDRENSRFIDLVDQILQENLDREMGYGLFTTGVHIMDDMVGRDTSGAVIWRSGSFERANKLFGTAARQRIRDNDQQTRYNFKSLITMQQHSGLRNHQNSIMALLRGNN